MSWIDWLVLSSTLLAIIVYGIYRSRGQKNIEGYLLANQSMPWYSVLFSVMATQASAITFLSAPGQAFTDGMRFVQFYFGLPLAMIVISIFFLPRFHKLKVYTAYEFLENRFDLKTRTFTALLFLIQRGLAAGLTIYAPAIILSSLLGWNIYLTNLIMGGLVIIYTVAGGTKAVSYTQMQQMLIIIIGMFIAGVMVVRLMPDEIGFVDALHIAGKMDRLNVITFNVDWSDRYNIWSGLIGGFFLALSYFGTDQSQVGRYLSGKSVAQSRLALLMNGIVKIPMQFLILLIGALLFTFYQFTPSPLFFNDAQVQKVKSSELAANYISVEEQYNSLSEIKSVTAFNLLQAIDENNKQSIKEYQKKLKELNQQQKDLRNEGIAIIKQADSTADTNDTNYIFLNFVINYLPAGLIGLLIAVIFSASWSSTASELNALASTSIVDIYKRSFNKNASDEHYLKASKIGTVIWGILAIAVAMFANQLGSLIEAVNILGSLFYGTILGVFLVAFFFKKVQGTAVFYAAILAEIFVIAMFIFDSVAFLWLNLIGCLMVVFISLLLAFLFKDVN
ncbi:MAG: sodium:solute symporter [Bacteroidia bacterium]